MILKYYGMLAVAQVKHIISASSSPLQFACCLRSHIVLLGLLQALINLEKTNTCLKMHTDSAQMENMCVNHSLVDELSSECQTLSSSPSLVHPRALFLFSPS